MFRKTTPASLTREMLDQVVGEVLSASCDRLMLSGRVDRILENQARPVRASIKRNRQALTVLIGRGKQPRLALTFHVLANQHGL